MPVYEKQEKFDRFVAIISDDINSETLIKIIQKIEKKNIEFWKNINNEFIALLYYRNKQMYVNSFVHVYRILEYISYAIPMIYVSKSKDFMGTYEDLKSFFKSDSGELNFFKTFLNKIFKGMPEASLEIEFNIDKGNINAELQEKLYQVYSKLIEKNNIRISSYSTFPNKISIL